MSKLEKLKYELADLIRTKRTEHDNHDPYWRGVRIGMETSIAILEDVKYVKNKMYE
jgi:hypothetical protein